MTIFNFERRGLYENYSGRGNAPWEGTLPLTAANLVNALKRGKKVVKAEEALALPAVMRSAQILAGTIAGARKTYLDLDDQHIKAPEGKVDILRNPNPMIDPWLFYEMLVLSVLFHGNFYAVLRREGRGGMGPVANLTPIPPSQIKPKFVTKVRRGRPVIVDKVFEWTEPGTNTIYGIPADEMLHVAGLGFDGLQGMSLLEYGSRTFSNAMNADEYADTFFENGAMMSGVLTTDKRLDKTAADAIQSRWRAKIQGIKNAFDVIVLDSGTKFEPITIKPADAQFVESRNFNVQEVGRLMGLPTELLGMTGERVLEPEKIAILYVKFTGELWAGRVKSAFDNQVLSEERSHFNIQHMITSDERTASAAAVMWRQAQVFSINELRVKQGEAPLDEDKADDPFYVSEEMKAAGAAKQGANQGKQSQQTPAGKGPGDAGSGNDNNL